MDDKLDQPPGDLDMILAFISARLDRSMANESDRYEICAKLRLIASNCDRLRAQRDELLEVCKGLKGPFDGKQIGRSKFWTAVIPIHERDELVNRATEVIARCDSEGGEG